VEVNLDGLTTDGGCHRSVDERAVFLDVCAVIPHDERRIDVESLDKPDACAVIVADDRIARIRLPFRRDSMRHRRSTRNDT
jgi:hypothetical protein